MMGKRVELVGLLKAGPNATASAVVGTHVHVQFAQSLSGVFEENERFQQSLFETFGNDAYVRVTVEWISEER